MKKNNSAGKPYYSQRNNKIKPGSACNVTSMINALSSAGWPVEELAAKGEQPEDALMKFIMSDLVCLAEWKKIDPKGMYSPNEWHSILARGTNRWLASFNRQDFVFSVGTAVAFTEKATARIIADHILEGGTACLSGTFPLKDGRVLNHVVAAVGVEEKTVTADAENEEADNTVDKTVAKEIVSFCIDDSWGDYRTGYENQNGNDVALLIADFLKYIKFCGNPVKMAHLVRRFA